MEHFAGVCEYMNRFSEQMMGFLVGVKTGLIATRLCMERSRTLEVCGEYLRGRSCLTMWMGNH